MTVVPVRPLKVISGGQTGVDRAALDAALALGLEAGGWCPRGRRAEDGSIPPRYPLTETSSSGYPKRTAWNVRDSDATLLLNLGELAGGSAYTLRLAERSGKPVRVVQLDDEVDLEALRKWLQRHRVETLNVAGPRESGRPGIYAAARTLLETLLKQRC